MWFFVIPRIVFRGCSRPVVRETVHRHWFNRAGITLVVLGLALYSHGWWGFGVGMAGIACIWMAYTPQRVRQHERPELVDTPFEAPPPLPPAPFRPLNERMWHSDRR